MHAYLTYGSGIACELPIEDKSILFVKVVFAETGTYVHTNNYKNDSLNDFNKFEKHIWSSEYPYWLKVMEEYSMRAELQLQTRLALQNYCEQLTNALSKLAPRPL